MGVDAPKRKNRDTHPLWLRVFVGILGGLVLAAFMMASADTVGIPIASVFALVVFVLPIAAMVRAKKVWSVFRIFEGM